MTVWQPRATPSGASHPPGRRLIVLVTVLLCLLAGCGEGGAPSSSNGAGASNIDLTTEASPSGPLTENFNPFYDSSALNLVGGTAMIYEPLLQFNLMKPGQINPWLASSYNWSNGGQTLTFQTRRGATWSDGHPFTSADVLFTFQLLEKYPAINSEAVSFADISAPNPNEVVLRFDSPAYTLLYYIGRTYIVPQHIWGNVGNPANYTNPHPVGTGPFTLQSFSPEGYRLVRNSHYWQPGLPKIHGLYYPVYNSNTSAGLALQQGALDWAGNAIPNLKERYVAKDPQHNHYSIVSTHTNYLIPNVTRYPLNLVAVRQAISLAIDREALSTLAHHGYNPPVTSPTGLTLPMFRQYLDPKYQDVKLTTDIDKAKALLKDAGFKMMPDGILQMPNGQPFKITFMAVTAYTEQITEGQIISNNLKKIGIDATVQGLSLQAAIADTGTGNFDLSINGSNTSPQPYDLYEQMLDSSLSAPIGQMAQGNIGRFKNAQADAYLQQLRTAGSRAAQQQALNGLESIMVNEVPVILTVYGVTFSEWSTAKVVGWPTSDDPYSLPSPGSPSNEVVALRLRPSK